jgi:Transposase IS200 like
MRAACFGIEDLMPDHVHMLLSIPPKYAVSREVAYIKGKSAIHLAPVYRERKRNFTGQHSWARGFFVNTVARDEKAIRATSATKRRKITVGEGPLEQEEVVAIPRRPLGQALPRASGEGSRVSMGLQLEDALPAESIFTRFGKLLRRSASAMRTGMSGAGHASS